MVDQHYPGMAWIQACGPGGVAVGIGLSAVLGARLPAKRAGQRLRVPSSIAGKQGRVRLSIRYALAPEGAQIVN
jgi:hypothetical protein